LPSDEEQPSSHIKSSSIIDRIRIKINSIVEPPQQLNKRKSHTKYFKYKLRSSFIIYRIVGQVEEQFSKRKETTKSRQEEENGISSTTTDLEKDNVQQLSPKRVCDEKNSSTTTTTTTTTKSTNTELL
jgi:hypothetical protein